MFNLFMNSSRCSNESSIFWDMGRFQQKREEPAWTLTRSRHRRKGSQAWREGDD